MTKRCRSCEQPIPNESNEHLVCPGCGAFCEVSSDRVKFCAYCGDKLVTRSELPRDIWKDPSVKEALKEGRPANDIAVLRCPECDELGYYNEGSTFSCRFCDLCFPVVTEGEEQRGISADEVIRMDDTLTEVTEGYHNQSS